MAVNGNAIHTGAKCPLKGDVRISEVRNSGVPLYTSYTIQVYNFIPIPFPFSFSFYYIIAGNFEGDNFRRLLAFAVPKNTTPPNFAEKNFTNN